MKILYVTLALFLTSCASMQALKYPVKIDLNTVNLDNQRVDAVCTVFSSSDKIETLAPKTITFITECSSINILCRAGATEGQYGMINTDEEETGNFLINSGLGYLFDRAVDSITPMGQLLNLIDSENCEMKDQKITIVLE
tara:strand:+ start:215 stop:634 length:420 start_codon:yes stop_codon:yes gene_type:complete